MAYISLVQPGSTISTHVTISVPDLLGSSHHDLFPEFSHLMAFVPVSTASFPQRASFSSFMSQFMSSERTSLNISAKTAFARPITRLPAFRVPITLSNDLICLCLLSSPQPEFPRLENRAHVYLVYTAGAV